jgi:hypothetical protein
MYVTFATIINSTTLFILCLIPSYLGRLHAEYQISISEINVKDVFLLWILINNQKWKTQ